VAIALDILRLADEIFIEEIRRAGLYDNIWQAFAVILPVKTVGVMGDGRTYDYVVALRAVTSTRRHDGGFLSVRHEVHWPRCNADHQRSEGGEPGGVRRDEQAAGDDRVGVRGEYCGAVSGRTAYATRCCPSESCR